MRHARRFRDLSGRLLLELVLIGLVLVAGRTVPLDEPPGTHWSLLVPFLLFVAHVALGLLALVDLGRLFVLARGLPTDGRGLVAAAGVGVLTAVASGSLSVLGAVDRSPAPLMLMGWLIATSAVGRLWFASRSADRGPPGSGPSHLHQPPCAAERGSHTPFPQDKGRRAGEKESR